MSAVGVDAGASGAAGVGFDDAAVVIDDEEHVVVLGAGSQADQGGVEASGADTSVLAGGGGHGWLLAGGGEAFSGQEQGGADREHDGVGVIFEDDHAVFVLQVRGFDVFGCGVFGGEVDAVDVGAGGHWWCSWWWWWPRLGIEMQVSDRVSSVSSCGVASGWDHHYDRYRKEDTEEARMNHHHRMTCEYIAATKALMDEARWDMLRGVITIAEWREEDARYQDMLAAARAELYMIALAA